MIKINPFVFQGILDKYNVSAPHFFQACEMNDPRQLLSDDGYHVHPFIERTVQAISERLAPMPSSEIKQLPVNILCEILKVDEITIRQWINYDRFPRAVRLAMATYQPRYFTGKPTIDVPKRATRRIATLKNIELGEYHKGEKCWRSPSIMGRKLPDIWNRTVDELRLTGYVKVRGNILQLTAKARKIIFKRG